MNKTDKLKKKFDILENTDTKICTIIYNKIKDYKIPHSENKNGLFINLSCISEEQINLLNTFLDKEYVTDDTCLDQIHTNKERIKFPIQPINSYHIEYKPFIINDLEKTIIDYSLS